MIKKTTDQGGKGLHPKRLKLKRLHKHVAHDSSELAGLPAEKLPPASSSNAARQARARLNITFPVDWQDLHLKKKKTDQGSEEGRKDDDIE